MTEFGDAHMTNPVRITCPGKWSNDYGEHECGRFVANLVGDYLDPPPCPSCGARFKVRVISNIPHYEIERGRRALTPTARKVDNPPEHT